MNTDEIVGKKGDGLIINLGEIRTSLQYVKSEAGDNSNDIKATASELNSVIGVIHGLDERISNNEKQTERQAQENAILYDNLMITALEKERDYLKTRLNIMETRHDIC